MGEFQIRGPSTMNGYLNNPSETFKAFDNGWLKTGDVGYFKDGKIYIIDRIKVEFREAQRNEFHKPGF